MNLFRKEEKEKEEKKENKRLKVIINKMRRGKVWLSS